MKQWKGIVIHHSATPDGNTYDWGAIRRYHKTDPMHLYSDIGYHFGIDKIGETHETLIGRSLRHIGAHCRGLNVTHIGICIVGNYDLVPPPDEAIAQCAELCRVLMDIYDIDINNIIGHNAWNPNKSCPGKLFDLGDLKNRIALL